MSPEISSAIPVADRVSGFSYAIRNIVAEARKVEAAGRAVRYLNIGDPISFGFAVPPHLVEAVARAMRDGENGYTPSPGIAAAREAVADDFGARGLAVDPDRVLLTSGTSEGIELTLTALLNPGDEVLVPVPTYPLYTAVIAKLGAVARYYRTDASAGWAPDLDHVRGLVGPRTRALVVIDPNNPTGAVYPVDVRRALLEIAERHGLLLIADEVYGDLGYDGPVPPIGLLDPDAAVVSYSSLSKAYLAPGWRAGWMAFGRTPRLDDLLQGVKKLADGRLCSPGPMQHAITAALRGDRSFQDTLRADLKARADVTTARLNAVEGMTCVAPRGAFYAMPQVRLPEGRTDVDFVLGLLRATGILCVFGSGFGCAPTDGYFRVVFLAPPSDLSAIYDDLGRFASDFLAGRGVS
jgi:alanine-synthesizing transaminase